MLDSRLPYTTNYLLEKEMKYRDRSLSLVDKPAIALDTVKKFKLVFSNYTSKGSLVALKDLYATDAFLNDRITCVEGSKKISSYFKRSFDKYHFATFDYLQTYWGDDDLILKWVLATQLTPGETTKRFLGMSHLRFNQLGKIHYQQDFWDYSEAIGQKWGVGALVNEAKMQA